MAGSSESYWWINAIGLWLSAVIAYHSITAYFAAGMPMFAFLCVTAQGVAIACAIMARRAATAGMPVSALAAGVAAAGTSWWASKGLAFAWEQSGQPVFEWAVWFICALEPGMFLLAEHIRCRRQQIAQEAADRAAEEAAILSQRQPFRPHVVGQPASQPAALAAVAAAVAASATQPASPAIPPTSAADAPAASAGSAIQHEPAGRVPGAFRPGFSREDDETHARRLLAEGLSLRRVALATRLSRYRVSQIAEGMGQSVNLAG